MTVSTLCGESLAIDMGVTWLDYCAEYIVSMSVQDGCVDMFSGSTRVLVDMNGHPVS